MCFPTEDLVNASTHSAVACAISPSESIIQVSAEDVARLCHATTAQDAFV